jgi:O-antigen ligase
MPARLALLVYLIPVFLAYRSDRKRGEVAPKALFWPSLWYMVVATHPLGYWFTLWGLPMPSGGDDAIEGSPIDRYFFATLTVIGFVILVRRRFDWGELLRKNSWLCALLAFMAVSILWSEYPFVSFKRYIKIIGSIVMALVVLTEERPLAATFTVLRRCLYVHLPMSILCTRYFREIGVAYTFSGTGQSWQGISTSKNTLGQIAMLGVVYFYWELRQKWQMYKWRNIHLLYLLMAIYLLKGEGDSVSMTSVSVGVIAIVIFTRIQALRERPRVLRTFVWSFFSATIALVTLVVVHAMVMFSEDSMFGYLITKFGRDITLTDRTNIWHDVFAATGNPLIGVGFGGFWIGRLANIPWASDLTWVLGQAHSGYIDTYLQLGLVGVFLLAGLLFSTLPRLLNSLDDNFDFGCFRITMFITIIFVNITETTFLRGDHQFWFITMLVMWIVPNHGRSNEESPVQAITV